MSSAPISGDAMIVVERSELKGSVCPPASKSVAHRALIAAVLSGKFVRITGNLQGDDVEATIRCLAAFASAALSGEALANAQKTLLCAAEIIGLERFGGKEKLFAIQRNAAGVVCFNVGESGSTLRFLLPVLAFFGVKAEIRGEGRLFARPLEGLISSLNAVGADIRGTSLPATICGKACADCVSVDGTVSSQFVTGLLLALAHKGSGTLLVNGERVSESYIDITLDVLKRFGCSVVATAEGFEISSTFSPPETFAVEADWSSAAVMLAAGALNGEIEVAGVNFGSKQGDRIVLDLLGAAGAYLSFGKNSVTVNKAALHAISFDAEDCPDIVPPMAVVLASAHGVSEISGVDRLRVKESDRIAAVLSLLASFGVRAEYSGGRISIFGGELQSGFLHSFNDHRIAMSGIIGAMRASGDSLLDSAACIAKSYPNFVRDLTSLGGVIREK